MVENILSPEDVRQLYERHGPALVAYACSYAVDMARAEDIVHGVFHRLLRGGIAVPEDPAGYLYRAVRNGALNARRNGAREAPLDEACFAHPTGNREAALGLQKALSELPEEQREMVIMRIWGGMTLNEAAAASGIPLNTAALRYWLAFADLQDPPSDKETQVLLERTAAGEAAWDEGRLGTILDKNETAVLRMQRATTLPECDWGLEYKDGWRASIAYAPKARVLARLNNLYGTRMAAKGETQRAVDSWLAGIGFSRHVAKGGPLIFALIAKATLLPDLKALTRAAQAGTLNAAQRKQVQTVALALPESAFDWGEAMRLEEAGIELAIDQIAAAKDPAQYYRDITGSEPPQRFALPTAAERLAFHKLMLSVEEALREPPDRASEKLKALQEQISARSWFFQQATPSFTKQNEARAEIATARQQLLRAVASR